MGSHLQGSVREILKLPKCLSDVPIGNGLKMQCISKFLFKQYHRQAWMYMEIDLKIHGKTHKNSKVKK